MPALSVASVCDIGDTFSTGRIGFNLLDDVDKDYLELDVAIYKYLDTSLCDVDVQTDYVLVTIKGKVSSIWCSL